MQKEPSWGTTAGNGGLGATRHLSYPQLREALRRFRGNVFSTIGAPQVTHFGWIQSHPAMDDFGLTVVHPSVLAAVGALGVSAKT